MIQIKRVYENANGADGARFLVDRLWPRGMKKESLKMESWLKDVAPSNELRHWYHHDLEQWSEFRKRYFDELRANPSSWLALLDAARRGTVTLLYGSKHTEHNNAEALKEFLTQQLKTGPASSHGSKTSRIASQ
ncbi:MAG TPA: DUF488 domain-containing protein [Terracidiphilus sp.]|nr:DUF488 domain-containing protein [Terracidiphilus sp.]